MSIADLPAWIRDQERRMAALEASHQFITNLLALSSFGVRLPANADRDDRLLRPSRIPWQRRPKARGHL